MAGLVAVTPAAGVVQPVGAIALGILASIVCYTAVIYKDKLGYDDSLDAFGIHGIGGIVGALFLTFFIRDSWMADATALHGTTWTMWDQLGIQAMAIAVAIVYAAVGTLLILWVVQKLVGLKSTEEEELQGMDHAYHSERGYGMLNPN